MPTDFSGVQWKFNQPSYKPGDQIIISITGGAVEMVQTNGQIGPLNLMFTAADGSTFQTVTAAMPVSGMVSTPESVKLTAVDDTGATPRAWSPGADGVSFTSVA